MKATILLAACLALAAARGAQAAPRSYAVPEPTAQLRSPADGAHAAGFEAAQANCLTCHSADYIAMQPPGRGAPFWEAEVTKMIKVYRAPIGETEGKSIAAYLSAQY